MALTIGLLVISMMVAALLLSGPSGGTGGTSLASSAYRHDQHQAGTGFRTHGGAATMRAIRGATQVAENTREHILRATTELLAEIMNRNGLTTDDVVSVLFTATPDLNAEFPAFAARKAGFHDVPLLCAAEVDVPGALPRVVRLMMYAGVDRPRADIQHVYLHGAMSLRQDIAG
ncbi:chorismate mutase [Streptomyces jumonjinensis]